MDATSRAEVRTKRSAGGRIALLIMLGAMLAGCDKCGNFWSQMGGAAQSETQACRELPPQPR
jgi:hypothetical protein